MFKTVLVGGGDDRNLMARKAWCVVLVGGGNDRNLMARKAWCVVLVGGGDDRNLMARKAWCVVVRCVQHTYLQTYLPAWSVGCSFVG